MSEIREKSEKMRDSLQPFLGQNMVKFAEKERGIFSKIAYLTAALGMLRIVFDICIPEIEKKYIFSSSHGRQSRKYSGYNDSAF